MQNTSTKYIYIYIHIFIHNMCSNNNSNIKTNCKGFLSSHFVFRFQILFFLLLFFNVSFNQENIHTRRIKSSLFFQTTFASNKEDKTVIAHFNSQMVDLFMIQAKLSWRPMNELNGHSKLYNTNGKLSPEAQFKPENINANV